MEDSTRLVVINPNSDRMAERNTTLRTIPVP